MVRRLARTGLIMAAFVAALMGNIAQSAAQSPGPISQLLAHIPDTTISRTVIRYGSLADLQTVILSAKLTAPSDFGKMSLQRQAAYALEIGKQVYYSPFTGLDKYAAWKKLFGIDSYAIERELTVGMMPDWYSLLFGKFNSSAIVSALQNLGYTGNQTGGTTIYSLDADNEVAGTTAGNLAGNLYNRLVVSDSQLSAAPSNAAIQAAIGNGGKTLGDDPVYKALAGALESANGTPSDTVLLSAVLFDGTFLSQKVITADPLTASAGMQLSTDQITALKAKLSPLTLLPAYHAVGMGYRRDADPKNRFWVIALIYDDATQATTARDALVANLTHYGSYQQNGRLLFSGTGWQIKPNDVQSVGGSLQVVTVTVQMPQQTDVSWLQLIESRDIGFLAAQS